MHRIPVRHVAKTLAEVDDRALEHAEDLIHERRHFDQLHGYVDPRVGEALTALSQVRKLTKRDG